MFANIVNTIYSLPTSNTLAALPVYPSDYKGDILSVPFIKLQVVTGSSENSAYRTKEVNGIVILSIFYKGGQGQAYPTTITAALDSVFENKLLSFGIQTSLSSLQFLGQDRDDPTLSRADYSVPFFYYGAT